MLDLNVLRVVHVMDGHLFTTRQLPPLFLDCSSLDERRNMNGCDGLELSLFPEIHFPS